MNRKIQDSDALFIVARYKRDPYVFSARGEAAKYEVSLRTIYNVLSKAGVKMRRGRKPLLHPPTLRLEFSIPDGVDKDEADRLIGKVIERTNELHHAMGGNGLKFETPPAPLISTSDAPQTPISAPAPAPAPGPLNPLDMLNLVDHLNHPKPPVIPKKPKRGPPVIRPKAR